MRRSIGECKTNRFRKKEIKRAVSQMLVSVKVIKTGYWRKSKTLPYGTVIIC